MRALLAVPFAALKDWRKAWRKPPGRHAALRVAPGPARECAPSLFRPAADEGRDG